jgi:hypothetical protein
MRCNERENWNARTGSLKDVSENERFVSKPLGNVFSINTVSIIIIIVVLHIYFLNSRAKHVSAATNIHAKIVELQEAVLSFRSVPGLYSERPAAARGNLCVRVCACL